MNKFCKDCKYHSKQRNWYWMLTRDICTRYHVNNVVTGEQEYFTCTTHRVIGECGSDGKYFEPKQPKQPSVIKTITKFFKSKSDVFKIIVVVCAVAWLTACTPSLQEVEKSKQQCTDLGGTPNVIEWKGTVQAVKCEKDGHIYDKF